MRFFWEGNELHYELESVTESTLTVIYCSGVKKEKIRQMQHKKFGEFLCRMLYFTTNVRTIEVVQPNNTTTIFTKQRVHMFDIKTARHTSPNSLFTLEEKVSIDELDFQLPTASLPSRFMLVTATATVHSSSLAKHILRVTHKEGLPKRVWLRLLFNHPTSPPEKWLEKGFVSIGFLSHQATGTHFHADIPVFSTYDRENLDLEKKGLLQWNLDLLHLAGWTGRLFFEKSIASLPAASFIQLWNSYSFERSAPKSEVGAEVEAGFFATGAPLIPCSSGKLAPADTLFWPDAAVRDLEFLQEYCPFVHGSFQGDEAEPIPGSLAAKLIERKYVKRLNLRNLHKYIDKTIDVSIAQAESIFRKLLEGKQRKSQELLSKLCLVPQGLLSALAHFATEKFKRAPLPPTCLPWELSRAFSRAELERLGFAPLTFENWWTDFLSKSQNLHKFLENQDTAEHCLHVLALQKNFEIPAKLRQLRCIRTSKGLLLPVEAYLNTVDGSDELPRLLVSPTYVPEAFLRKLGVRAGLTPADLMKSVKSNTDLIPKLLSAFQAGELQERDLEDLKGLAFVPTVTLVNGKQVNAVDVPAGAILPDRAGRLYNLGFPVVNLPERQLLSQFFVAVGVQPCPRLKRLFSPTVDMNRLSYFFENFELYRETYSPNSTLEFLPNQHYGKVAAKQFSAPCATFLEDNPFGDFVLHPDFRKMAPLLQLRPHPPLDMAIDRLLAVNLNDHDVARRFYVYFSQRAPELSVKQTARIRSSPIIPTATGLLPPNQVVFGSPETRASFGPLFEYVDFGEVANAFLALVGVGSQPTTELLVRSLCKNHVRFLQSEGAPRYVSLLRQVCSDFHWSRLAAPLKELLRTTPLVLATNKAGQQRFCLPEECFRSDNNFFRNLFDPWTAVAFEELEILGCRWLSSVVLSKGIEVKGTGKKTARTREFQKSVRERAPLLVIDENGEPLSGLKREAMQLLSHLAIREFASLEKTIQFQEKVVKRSTTSTLLKRGKKNILCLTPQGDLGAVAEQISKLIFQSPSNAGGLEREAYLSYLLAADFESLQERGYPLDRILARPEPEVAVGELLLADEPEAEAAVEAPPEPRAVDVGSDQRLAKQAVQALANTGKARKGRPPKAENAPDVCNILPEDQLELHYHVGQVAYFVDKSADASQYPPDVVVKRLATLVAELARIFKKGSSLLTVGFVASVYFSETDGTVAFNRNGQLSFNAYYFWKMHWGRAKMAEKASVYYFATFCHEIAHNISSSTPLIAAEHNKDHEQAMEALLVTHMMSFLENAERLQALLTMEDEEEEENLAPVAPGKRSKPKSRRGPRSKRIRPAGPEIVDLTAE